MKKIIFYCLTVTLLFLAACKKEKTAQLPTNPVLLLSYIKLNPAALEFVQLPLNRYFIYKDSATGSVDSVIVTKSIIENIFHAGTSPNPGSTWNYGTPDYYYEKYTLELKKIAGSPAQDWFNGFARCGDSYTNLDFVMMGNPPVFTETNFSLSNQQFQLSAFLYPFTTYGVNTYIFISMLTIEGTTYTGVHRFIASNGLQPSEPNYQENIFYWVKGIGIIKKEIRTFNSVKTSLLVRYG